MKRDIAEVSTDNAAGVLPKLIVTNKPSRTARRARLAAARAALIEARGKAKP